MADKKTKAVEIEETTPVVEEVIPEYLRKEYYIIPFDNANDAHEEKFKLVTVNGIIWQIEKGRRLKLPLYIIEVLENSRKALAEAKNAEAASEQAYNAKRREFLGNN